MPALSHEQIAQLREFRNRYAEIRSSSSIYRGALEIRAVICDNSTLPFKRGSVVYEVDVKEPKDNVTICVPLVVTDSLEVVGELLMLESNHPGSLEQLIMGDDTRYKLWEPIVKARGKKAEPRRNKYAGLSLSDLDLSL